MALVAGCQSDQSSADAVFDNRPNGALTFFMLQQLNREGSLSKPLSVLIDDIRSAVSGGGYEQVPQLRGQSAITSLPFAGGLPAIVRRATTQEGKMMNLSGAVCTVRLKDISVTSEEDLANLLRTMAPHFARVIAEEAHARGRDWSVSGTVSTTIPTGSGSTTGSVTATVGGRDATWQVAVQASTNVGPVVVAGGVNTGSQGTNGQVSVGVHF
jgi:hypothetical protein